MQIITRARDEGPDTGALTTTTDFRWNPRDRQGLNFGNALEHSNPAIEGGARVFSRRACRRPAKYLVRVHGPCRRIVGASRSGSAAPFGLSFLSRSAPSFAVL